ncbi:MAG: toll/interleukin-1 receptor domain-containing protein [Hyphomonas sp.]|nr:toll/interleukin-1 receptor domain-containing protein [Hyphomonas sp.]
MAYDIFLVSALEDRDMAKLIARRLRSLKFKVWFDQKQVDQTFDAKDARDSANSESMLVLWSENAVKSDWVRAAASVGNSRPGMLVQAGLDKTIPYEPFRHDKRYSIAGMTSRKTPEGFYKIVEELGSRQERTDLRAWMNFSSKDDEARDAWLAAHPADPLAIDAAKKKAKAMGVKPAPAAEAAGAASLAASSMKAGNGNGARGGISQAVGRASAGARAGTVVMPEADLPADDNVGAWTIGAVLFTIALILMFSVWMSRDPLPAQMRSGLPAIGNAYNMQTACPAGTVPRALLEVLEPGPIINDVDEPAEPETDPEDE